jgi:endonuclease-3
MIKEYLLSLYPDTKTELIYRDEYELLVSIILSAQCTDKRVNIITPNLFSKYPTIYDMAEANVDDIIESIKSCNFFQNKAKHLKQMAIYVVTHFDGKIPKNITLLKKLDGVGEKTARVFLIETENSNIMAVDTHVYRVSHRLGLSKETNPTKVALDLERYFKNDLDKLHQAMVLFGRYLCKAKNPDCHNCGLKTICCYLV